MTLTLNFITVLVIMVVGGAAYWLGKRRGLRAPLTARTVALRADVRRAENALGVTVPRVRSARYNRRTGRR